MAHLPQLLRQLAHALARPPQRRLRVAASFRCDEQFEIIGQGPIDVRELLSTGPWSSDPLQLRRLLRWLECHPLELSNADANPLAQHARCRSDRRKASSSDCLRLGGEPKTCLALVPCRRQQRKLSEISSTRERSASATAQSYNPTVSIGFPCLSGRLFSDGPLAPPIMPCRHQLRISPSLTSAPSRLKP